MRSVIVIVVATAIGAAALGVFKGMQVKDQILEERRQAREDSIAAVALANSEAAVSDTADADGVSPEEGAEATDPAGAAPTDGQGTSAVGTEEAADEGETPTEAGQPDAGGGDAGGGGDAPEQDEGPSAAELAEAERQAREAEALAQQTLDRLSKIFSEMKPTEAADVLSYLSDSEIERILLGIRERDAAAILAQLEPERAAAVSRRVLRRGGSTE